MTDNYEEEKVKLDKPRQAQTIEVRVGRIFYSPLEGAHVVELSSVIHYDNETKIELRQRVLKAGDQYNLHFGVKKEG